MPQSPEFYGGDVGPGAVDAEQGKEFDHRIARLRLARRLRLGGTFQRHSPHGTSEDASTAWEIDGVARKAALLENVVAAKAPGSG